MDVSRALERYLRHHRAEGSTAKTLDWHRLSIGQFAGFLASNRESAEVEDLCADDLRQWIEALQARGLTQSSVATKVRSVKAFGKWLAAEDYVNRDPFARVKRPHVDDVPPDTLSPADIARLLTACKAGRQAQRDTAIMLLLFSTGLRAAELLGLQMGDIDWDRGLLLIRRGKGGKFRTVPLSRPVERALERYVRGRDGDDGAVFLTEGGEPLRHEGLYHMLLRLEERTGIHANPHKWRHSSAVQYLRNGGRVEVLRVMLGHSTLDMTLHYARIAGVDVIAAHDSADPLRSLKRR